MKNAMKKVLSIMLVAVMLFSTAPLSGFVGLELPDWLDFGKLFAVEAEAANYSGKCGDNLTWSLNTSTGVLNITGTGAMYNYASSTDAPWRSYGGYIKKITIGNSVTSIGDNAFNRYANLTSVTLGNSITTIGDYAFVCGNFASVTIPSSVTSIGDFAFYACDDITTVAISYGVMYIGDSAFSNCTSLTKVTIPEKVAFIGEDAFSWCNRLESINVDSNNKNYSSDNYGALFNKAKTKLIQYPTGNTRTSYIVPDSVIDIGKTAFFKCTYLKSIAIGNSVASIEKTSLNRLDNLQAVTVDAENKYYSSDDCGVLFDKNKTMLIKYPTGNKRESYTVPNSVTTIVEGAFDCQNLTSVIIPNGVKFIGDYAFCSINITSVIIPESVTNIGSNAFSGCNNLTNVIIRSQSTGINDYAFAYCNSLEYLHIPSGVTAIGENILYDSSAYICSTEENCYAKSYADKYGIDFKVCDGHRFAIFSTEKSFTVKTGEKMSLAFGSIIDGKLDGEWEKMAITVSDPTVISLSDYKKTEYGYALDVLGKKEGISNLVVTDAATGEYIVLTVTVDDSFVETYSYAIDTLPTFYPNNNFENNVKTNIYNLNGIYINNYQCTKNGNKYEVSFNAYNEQYHHAAVDIYDADGNWIAAERIDKYNMIASLFDTGDQVYYMITDWDWLSYTHNMHTKMSPVKFEVPDGGYFEISNNYAESPGCFLYNSIDIFLEGVSAAIDVITDDIETPFYDLIKNKLQNDKSKRDIFLEIFIKAADKEIRDYSKNLTNGMVSNSYEGICGLFDNMLGSMEIDWRHFFSITLGLTEAVIKKLSGSMGLVLDGCFEISDATNRFLQGVDIGFSVDEPYVCVYSDIEEGYINPHGVIVNTNGNVDAETVLQVFRISNDDSVKVVLDSNNPLEMHELYNISFVKNDKNVQPNGKVKVHVPIPEGMDSNTSKIYRQEADGSWTVLNAKVEGNYLVFETDHFSLYAIIGDKAELKIASLPDKLTYTMGDTLDSTGLSLELNGNVITSGFICDSTVIYEIGKQTITVRYEGLTAEFDVKVNMNAPEISVPSTTTINYGDTLIIKLGEFNLPKVYFVEWSVNGSGVKIQPSEDGTQCKVTSVSSGTVTITAKIVDKDGKPVTDADGTAVMDEITLKSNAGFFQKLISFFKNLFGIGRVINSSVNYAVK